MSDGVVLAGVTHRYGRTLALDAVDLAVPRGAVAGLIGPDGVGKSTVLALAAGVKRLQSGRVLTLGLDLSHAAGRREVRGRIAYMPQGLGRNLYPTLSVAENLDFFGRLFAMDATERRDRSSALLTATGLMPFRDRAAGKLSGGMKQKLGICAALLHDPDLLLLDEPTTGIDPLSRRQFWELVDRIRARRPGMGILVATATMEEAEGFDWLAAMDGGRVVAAGSPAEVKAAAGAATLEHAFVSLVSGGAPRPVEPVRTALPPDGEPAVEARGLTRRFGDFIAVDDVSFSIRRGEIFGFLGSNGSGKTTTMKMLTGLLPATSGEASLLGRPVEAGDPESRRRVGYMSQSFSLYGELTVRQNLALHAALFDLPRAAAAGRIGELLARFDLADFADARPEGLPVGIRQRLQLAVAVLHRPDVLILDEPTSGVDPIARDAFWRELVRLSREEKVTIFLSTHFMNEAERCDRISFMHAGRVISVGAPSELKAAYQVGSLEAAFIAAMEAAGMAADSGAALSLPDAQPRAGGAGLVRFGAFARREALEILRDPARLLFAFAGPALLMVAFGYGISFDVENIPFAVHDEDRTAASRSVVEAFEGSRYFEERSPAATADELDRRLSAADIVVGIDIPAGFGADLARGVVPEVGVSIDGAMPFRAETARSYVAGVTATAAAQVSPEEPPVTVEPRFLFNQAFRSADAMVPGVLMLLLVLIPAIMTAVGVVREKETGSIANFRATPATPLEFLAGKQLPYVAVNLASFAVLLALSQLVFAVPIRGSLATLLVGTVLYLYATTGVGLLLSSVLRSQVAAIFATAILTIIPTVNFSGLLVPVSSLAGPGRVMGLLFPAGWYQPVSVGVFAKGLGFGALWPNLLVLLLFAVGLLGAAALALRKEER